MVAADGGGDGGEDDDQDPLSELVKVEPHHLGVGMYQHDLSQARLSAALEQVVEECVSFVGVDINSCSEHLLRRVAGLNVSMIYERQYRCNTFVK